MRSSQICIPLQITQFIEYKYKYKYTIFLFVLSSLYRILVTENKTHFAVRINTNSFLEKIIWNREIYIFCLYFCKYARNLFFLNVS